MMYILYNNDGSIKGTNLTDFIQKGNDGVNSIFLAIEGRSNSDWTATCVFVLPNGESEILAAQQSTQTIAGVEYSGWLLTITASVTVYEGIVKFSVDALDLYNRQLFTYQGKLVINPSSIIPNETKITYAQYQNLLNYIKSYLGADAAAEFYIDATIDVRSYQYHYTLTTDEEEILRNCYFVKVKELITTNYTYYDAILVRANNSGGAPVRVNFPCFVLVDPFYFSWGSTANNYYLHKVTTNYTEGYHRLEFYQYTGNIDIDGLDSKYLINLGSFTSGTMTVGDLRALMTQKTLYSFEINGYLYVGYITTTANQTNLFIARAEGVGFKYTWSMYYDGNNDSLALVDLLDTTSPYFVNLAPKRYRHTITVRYVGYAGTTGLCQFEIVNGFNEPISSSNLSRDANFLTQMSSAICGRSYDHTIVSDSGTSTVFNTKGHFGYVTTKYVGNTFIGYIITASRWLKLDYQTSDWVIDPAYDEFSIEASGQSQTKKVWFEDVVTEI